MAALVYQTAWERMLRLVFGASTAASSAVLAIFLGGLGVGGAWLGARAETSDRPLLLYGKLETGVALSAAATPFLIHVAARIYWALGGSAALGNGGATVLRVVLAAIVLGPSVVMMGGTLPAAARAVEHDDDLARGRLALLYAVNTLGAVAGAFVGTFVLFELFGTRLSLWVAALVNLLVAVLARRDGASARRVPLAKAAAQGDLDAPPAQRAWPIYACAGVLGFAFLALEVVWYRVLGPILGGSSFTFGVILGVALAGIGAGGFVYARRAPGRPATVELLALTIAAEAACVLMPLALGDGVALFAAYTRPMAAVGFSTLAASWIAAAAVVVLPAAVVAGYQFPVLFALLGTGRARVARQVGLAYAFNTAGSIAGALLVGFVLMPRLGAVGVWRLVGALLGVLAVALLAIEHRAIVARGVLRLIPTAAVLSVSFFALTAPGPSAVSRHTPIGAGRVALSGYDRNGLRSWRHQMQTRVLWERDGVESSLAVVYGDGITFLVSGKADGAVFGDRGTQALLGVMPALLHDAPKNAFVLGLGTGMTAGWLAAIPSVERVDVAELEPSIIEVARAAGAANQNVLERANVALFVGDGREFLLTTKRRYDLIVSEPSNPYRSGVASLFTEEFYRVADARLSDKGLFAQWLQAYEVDVETIRVVISTLRRVFPFVEIWQTQGGDLILLASREPRVYDVDRLRQRVMEEPYRSVLPRAGLIADAEGVLSRFLAGNELVGNIAASTSSPANTDDDNLLEYSFARHVGASGGYVSTELAVLTQSRGLARPQVTGTVNWDRVDELRGRAWLVVGGGTAPNLPIRSQEVRARTRGFAAGCTGDLVSAHRNWFSQKDTEPRDVLEKYALGVTLAHARDERALAWAGELERDGFRPEAMVVRARYLAGKGNRDAALDELLAAVTELRSVALPLCDAHRQAVALIPFVVGGDKARAARAARHLLVGPLAVYNEEERRIQVAQQMAFLSGDAALCVDALGKNLDLPWWELPFLAARAECLERAGHPAAHRARAQVGEWVGGSLGSIETGLTLPRPQFALPAESDAGVLEPVLDAGAAPQGAAPSHNDAGSD